MHEIVPVISVDKDKCLNCHRCISVCPAKFCNDGSGDYIKINSDLCLGCGHCIDACVHGARVGIDDFSDFMMNIKDILSNELITLYGRPNTAASERFKLTAEFVASGTVAMYLRWLRGEADISMDELAMLAAEMITNGAAGLVDMI